MNPYEYIRKYACENCDLVAMCNCEEEFARKFLPHQLAVGRDLETKLDVPVTGGFRPGMCNPCRGKREEPHPRSEIRGRTSKFRRYYWRELFFETTKRFSERLPADQSSNWLEAVRTNKALYEQVEQEVVDELKKQHEDNPKYDYHEPSQKEVLDRCGIEIIHLSGPHIRSKEKPVLFEVEGKLIPVHEFAAKHFEGLGYQVLFTESRPFHALFGVMMWLLIEDPADELGRMSGFGERIGYETSKKKEMMWTILPADFGGNGYFKRRKVAIEEHLDKSIDAHKDELPWLFDYWTEYSEKFRQYLWAHRREDVDLARKILELLSPNTIRQILEFLIEDYWGRYLGWPDLLVYKKDEDWFFVEVKSSKDKLSGDQKKWMTANTSGPNFRVKLVKVHNRAPRDNIR